MASSALQKYQSLVLYFLTLASATCYYPDGTAAPGDEIQPCPSTVGGFSMCCATNKASGFDDQCQPSGLCWNPCTPDGCTTGAFWRELCTDPTWQSPFCLRGVFTNSSENGSSASGAVPVSQCPVDGKWCSGKALNSTACCAADVKRVEIASSAGVSSVSSTVSSTSTSSTASISSNNDFPPLGAIQSSAPTARPIASNNGREIALGVGIGVGGVICIVSAVITAFIELRRRRQRKAPGNLEDNCGSTGLGSGKSTVIARAELDTSHHQKFEICSLDSQAELPCTEDRVHEVHGWDGPI